jgi:NADH-quinone oxidoreductase subunit N
MNSLDFYYIIPLLSVTILSLVILVLEIIFNGKIKVIFNASLIGVIACIFITINYFELNGIAFNGMVQTNPFTNFFSLIFLIAVLLTILFSKDYLGKSGYNFGEYYILILFSVVGMMLMVSSLDFMTFFLGIEIMSICFYILAGFFRKRLKSNEAALKYFLLGAFATGFLLYGIALVYGTSGTTSFMKIFTQITILKTQTLFLIGCGLIVVGLSFKIAAFPFHAYVPDVYEGSPTTISGFMSTAGKSAAFGSFILLALFIFSNDIPKIRDVIIFISIISMIIGNLIAIVQKNLKRMLAYSSIAHAGYMLIGLASNNILGLRGILFYLLVYTFMQIGAFAIVSIMEKGEDDNLNILDYNVLGYNKPALAVFMSIFMFSLAGIPPFGGFFGKYYIFIAAIEANLLWLAIFGAMASVVSVYFYINVIVAMYFKGKEEYQEIFTSKLSISVLTIITIILLFIGILPGFIMEVIGKVF